MTIKAIETHYKGYRFRSRLEARWAVFFDAHNERWEYEPEGFDLDRHGWYLPDFRLPDLRCYVEIKPIDYVITQELEDKLSCLHEGTDHGSLLFVGAPGDAHYDGATYKIYCSDTGDSSAGLCSAFVLPTYNDLGELVIAVNIADSHEVYTSCMFDECPSRIVKFSDAPTLARNHQAERRARSARFEHGECPA